MRVERIYNTYNRVIKPSQKLDSRHFASKLCGAVTDHANDQKALVSRLEEWKRSSHRFLQGQEVLENLPLDDLVALIYETSKKKVAAVGGIEAWGCLSESEKLCWSEDIFRDLCITMGEKEFQNLSDSERQELSIFIWSGCGMHKELNMIKGATLRMHGFWGENNIPGPVPLMNKDNAAAFELGGEAVQSRVQEVTQSGGVKATTLAGKIFHDKDDKKGQQDFFRYYFENELGHSVNFPDTSNTRYGSHCEAASEIIAHLDVYIRFMELLQDLKETRTFNHMEANLFKALQDLPTIAELCVLATFSQVISRPYLRRIRGTNGETPNSLDLGLLHDEVLAYIHKIIGGPDSVIGDDETLYLTATLDGTPWDRPEVFEKIQLLKPSLPYLRNLLVEFCKGAEETWIRFTTEFQPGGLIDSLSVLEQKRIYLPATNCVSEGSLGQARVLKRQKPNMTEDHFNSRTISKSNGTVQWMKDNLTDEQRMSIRKEARDIHNSGIEKQLHIQQVQHANMRVEVKKGKDREKEVKRAGLESRLNNIKLIETLEELKLLDNNSLTREKLDWQLEWHRHRGGYKVPCKSAIPNRGDKMEALKSAIIRYQEHKSNLEHPSGKGIHQETEQETVLEPSQRTGSN